MAFILSNLLSSLDSSIGLLDSSSDLLEVLQALNVTNSTKGHGKSQKRTYDTVASLPTATSALRGFFATVETVGDWEASENADNGLYLCNGSDWTLIQGLDSAGTPPPFQGSNFGYVSGGKHPFLNYANYIDKFPFASDGNTTDHGDLTVGRRSAAGQSSSTHGYTSGGEPQPSAGNVIDKFLFSSNANATNVGDLTLSIEEPAGQSSIGNGYGYTSGGNATTDRIEKFPFSTDANATDIGNLTLARWGVAGQSSSTHGYTSGGRNPVVTNLDVDGIDKFSFATDGDATDVGNLTVARRGVAGQSSSTHGYTSGGLASLPVTAHSNIIDKFPFASDGDATDVGDLTVARWQLAGQSSTTHGYSAGGLPSNTVIDKFPFTSDDNATDVGDIASLGRTLLTGQQY